MWKSFGLVYFVPTHGFDEEGERRRGSVVVPLRFSLYFYFWFF